MARTKQTEEARRAAALAEKRKVALEKKLAKAAADEKRREVARAKAREIGRKAQEKREAEAKKLDDAEAAGERNAGGGEQEADGKAVEVVSNPKIKPKPVDHSTQAEEAKKQLEAIAG